MSQQTNSISDLEWDLADRLRKSLRTSGVSVGAMADHLEVSANTASNYVNGHTTPSAATLRTWALRTGVPYEWLRFGQLTENGPDTPSGLGNPATRWKADSDGRSTDLRPRRHLAPAC